MTLTGRRATCIYLTTGGEGVVDLRTTVHLRRDDVKQLTSREDT